MSAKSIVVTGGNSYLGRVAIEYLKNNTDCEIVVLLSPRSEFPAKNEDRVLFFQADLTVEPSSEIASAISRAERVFHFAWSRSIKRKQATQDNIIMLNYLFALIKDPSKLIFISSVSASPKSFSEYGANKYKADQMVQQKGGVVLSCGLVVEPSPLAGPFKTLKGIVSSMPFSFRAIHREPLVFPLRLEDLGSVIVYSALKYIKTGIYKIFSKPVGLNEFLEIMENLSPRHRIRLPFSAGLALGVASLAKKSGAAPDKLCDQVMTFLYKDSDYLLSHLEIPNLVFRPCEGKSFFISPLKMTNL